ncbi:hypothetical protein NMY22_g20113 [Coprinellus aureogranulatus]|nr:hypothetical protein NMY22_g20113 [Coprinellus aureogranulatus]
MCALELVDSANVAAGSPRTCRGRRRPLGCPSSLTSRRHLSTCLLNVLETRSGSFPAPFRHRVEIAPNLSSSSLVSSVSYPPPSHFASKLPAYQGVPRYSKVFFKPSHSSLKVSLPLFPVRTPDPIPHFHILLTTTYPRQLQIGGLILRLVTSKHPTIPIMRHKGRCRTHAAQKSTYRPRQDLSSFIARPQHSTTFALCLSECVLRTLPLSTVSQAPHLSPHTTPTEPITPTFPYTHLRLFPNPTIHAYVDQ